MSEEVSRKDLEDVVAVLSETVSGVWPGKRLYVVERRYMAWRQEELFICEIETSPSDPTLCRGISPSARPDEARSKLLSELAGHGFPRASSGEEMKLKLSILPEEDLRRTCCRFLEPVLRWQDL